MLMGTLASAAWPNDNALNWVNGGDEKQKKCARVIRLMVQIAIVINRRSLAVLFTVSSSSGRKMHSLQIALTAGAWRQICVPYIFCNIFAIDSRNIFLIESNGFNNNPLFYQFNYRICCWGDRRRQIAHRHYRQNAHHPFNRPTQTIPSGKLNFLISSTVKSNVQHTHTRANRIMFKFDWAKTA